MPYNLIPLLSALFSFLQDFYFLFEASIGAPLCCLRCSPCCAAGCAAPVPESHLHLLPPCPCHPSASLFPPVCDCTLSQLSPAHRVTCSATCSLLSCTARLLCCSCPRRGSATVTFTAPLPHLFTRLMRLRALACPTIPRFLSVLCHLSFT